MEGCLIELFYVSIWRVFIDFLVVFSGLCFVFLFHNVFNVNFSVSGFLVAGNEYTFYLAIATLASGMGSMQTH